jgi:hypothetical protein
LPLTPMEKGLLLEDALICVRMLRALHQTSPYSGTCVESEQPNLWIAAALAVLAGRIDAACAASIFGNIKHYQYYGLVKSKVGMVHIKGRVRAGGESVAELIEGDMEELRDLEEVLEEGEHNRPGIAAVLRTRCEREPCDVLERFAAGWGGDMAAPGRYGPLAPFGGPIPGRVPLPATSPPRHIPLIGPLRGSVRARRVAASDARCTRAVATPMPRHCAAVSASARTMTRTGALASAAPASASRVAASAVCGVPCSARTPSRFAAAALSAIITACDAPDTRLRANAAA